MLTVPERVKRTDHHDDEQSLICAVSSAEDEARGRAVQPPIRMAWAFILTRLTAIYCFEPTGVGGLVGPVLPPNPPFLVAVALLWEAWADLGVRHCM